MPRLKSLDELARLREKAQHELAIRQQTMTKITVGMGTCGIAAGARETMQAILEELKERDIEAHVATVPGSAFGDCGEGYLRLSYSTSKENIVEGLKRIDSVLEKYS